jgi:RHS repeat-associated protein
MAYDVNSQRTVLSDWTGSYTSSWDPVGRLSSVVNPAGIALTYGYDAVGQRARLSQPTGLFTYTYDPVGRISRLVNPENQVSTWQYDAASRVTAILLANGTQASYTYDHADHLLLLANLTSGGTTLSSFNYTYNSIGNRTQVVEANSDVVSWTYDPTYQLTNEERSGANAYNITYVYDPVGNRTLLLNGGAATTSTYNAANELAASQTAAGTTTYAFDRTGNLLTSLAPGNQWTTNTWDDENRLTQVALPSGIVNSFSYNGDGQRVQKQDSSGTTNHVWDGHNILLETNASNTIQVVYTLEPRLFGHLVSQSRGGTDSFYLFDGLGSARQLANRSSSLSDSYVFDSFGGIVAHSGTTTNPFRFVGRRGYYYDSDTADVYVRRRFYATAAGRFISRDPISSLQIIGVPMMPPGSYVYVWSNPVMLVDPSGMQPGDINLQPILCPAGQYLTCLGMCGPTACCQGYFLSVTAHRWADQLSGGHDPNLGTPNDALRHCIWSCLMAADLGKAAAKCVADVHELCQNRLSDVVGGQLRMDLANNEVGRACAAGTAGCRKCCEDALKAGKLTILYPPSPILGPPRYGPGD